MTPVIFIASALFLAFAFASGRHGGNGSLQHKLKSSLERLRQITQFQPAPKHCAKLPEQPPTTPIPPPQIGPR
jgi:hypothetical protein